MWNHSQSWVDRAWSYVVNTPLRVLSLCIGCDADEPNDSLPGQLAVFEISPWSLFRSRADINRDHNVDTIERQPMGMQLAQRSHV